MRAAVSVPRATGGSVFPTNPASASPGARSAFRVAGCRGRDGLSWASTHDDKNKPTHPDRTGSGDGVCRPMTGNRIVGAAFAGRSPGSPETALWTAGICPLAGTRPGGELIHGPMLGAVQADSVRVFVATVSVCANVVGIEARIALKIRARQIVKQPCSQNPGGSGIPSDRGGPWGQTSIPVPFSCPMISLQLE